MDSWRVVRLKFFSKNSKCILFSKIKKVPPTWKEQAKIYKRRLWRSASSLIIGILLTLAICRYKCLSLHLLAIQNIRISKTAPRMVVIENGPNLRGKESVHIFSGSWVERMVESWFMRPTRDGCAKPICLLTSLFVSS